MLKLTGQDINWLRFAQDINWLRMAAAAAAGALIAALLLGQAYARGERYLADLIGGAA